MVLWYIVTNPGPLHPHEVLSNTNNFYDKESEAVKYISTTILSILNTSDITHSESNSQSKWHVKINFLYYEMFLCVCTCMHMQSVQLVAAAGWLAIG